MRKYLRIIMFAVMLLFSSTAMAQDYNILKTLKATAQDLTGAWVALGDKIRVTGGERLTLWLVLDINNSNNARVRIAYYRSASDAVAYLPQILTPSASDIKIEPEYYEANVDADQNIILDFGVTGTVYAQVQVMAGTVGATAGQIDESYYMLVKK